MFTLSMQNATTSGDFGSISVRVYYKDDADILSVESEYTVVRDELRDEKIPIISMIPV